MYVSANIADRIRLIAKSKSISVKQLLEDVGLGFNTMSNMKTSVPKADNLARIADYLNCSVDYLLGRTDDPEINQDNISQMKVGITEHEKRLIAAYRNKPEMQSSVDKLLDIEENTSRIIYRAARSDDNTEPRLEKRSVSDLDKFKRATPVTSDDDL